MSTSALSPQRVRRTQAERRAATRTALLDATIECLVEEGYARTTTRGIAERAGVTPGALQHHFPSKAELLSEAIRHVWAKFAQEFLAHGTPSAPSVLVRSEQLIDRMWEVHKGPLFQASTELFVAARTDEQLRSTLAEAQRDMANWNAIGARVLFPELADRAGLAQLIATGQAAIRGLALIAFLNEHEADEAWSSTRRHIFALNADFIADTEPAT
jgi:AcrR family transcriptional regulator